MRHPESPGKQLFMDYVQFQLNGPSSRQFRITGASHFIRICSIQIPAQFNVPYKLISAMLICPQKIRNLVNLKEFYLVLVFRIKRVAPVHANVFDEYQVVYSRLSSKVLLSVKEGMPGPLQCRT